MQSDTNSMPSGFLRDPAISTVQDRLRRELRNIIFGNAYAGAGWGCLVLVPMALVLWEPGTHGAEVRWFLAMFLCLLSKLVVAIFYRVRGGVYESVQAFPFWTYYGLTCLEAIGWGLSIFVLFPAEPLQQSFLMVILVGITAAGLSLFSGCMSLHAIWVIAIMGQMFLKLELLNSDVYAVLGALMLFLGGMFLMIARYINVLLLRNLQLRFTNEQLAMIETTSKENIIGYSEKLSDKTIEIEHMTKRLQSLVSLLSNDLRTQLITISQFSHFLREGKGSTHDQKFIVETLSNSADSGLRLIAELLELAGIESSGIQLNLGSGSIQQVVEGAVGSTRLSAQRKNVRINLAIDEPRPVRMDFKKIEEVLTNLLDNALIYSPPEGSVTVQTTPTSRGLRVEVIDMGIGIDQTGATFATSQEILRAHDSHIEVQNNPEAGCCCSFVLPWADREGSRI